jgi:23S rRNA (uracil1939-C5)-methyltransferase
MWNSSLRRNETTAEPFGGEAEALIEKLRAGGEGLAMIRGRSVYVPLTAPGDRVRIAYGGAHGRVLERLSDGPDRVAPPCPHFGPCGGCALQHIEAEAYRGFKEDLLRDALAREGFDGPPLASLTSIPAHTRRRATFAFRREGDGVALGFYGAHTRKLLDLAECRLLSPRMEAALPALRGWLAALPAGAEGRLHLTLTETGLDADLSLGAGLSAVAQAALAGAAAPLDLARLTLGGALLLQNRVPLIRFAGIALTPPPGAFLQPSAEGEAQLLAWVEEGVGKARRIADLFCGLGTFALPLARRAAVHAVDSDAALLAAMTAAHRAASGLKPLTAETRDLMRNPLPPAALAKFDAAVLDPPRAGARAQTLALAKSGIPRIIAVSCNPASFARDARVLVDAGYSLDWVRPLDQFLWSAHLELVALLTKPEGR